MRKLRAWRTGLSATTVYEVTIMLPLLFWVLEMILLRNDAPEAARYWGYLAWPVYITVVWLNLHRHRLPYSARKENLRMATDDLLQGREDEPEVDGEVRLPADKVRALVLAAQAVTDRRDG